MIQFASKSRWVWNQSIKPACKEYSMFVFVFCFLFLFVLFVLSCFFTTFVLKLFNTQWLIYMAKDLLSRFGKVYCKLLKQNKNELFVGSLLRIQLSDLSGYPFIFGAQFWQETSWVEPKYKKSVTWSSLTVTRKYVNGVCAIFSNTVDARFVGGSVAVVGQACLWATPALSIKLKTKTQIPHFLCFLCASIYRLVNIMPV